jgi:ABC-type sulfate transport system permease component
VERQDTSLVRDRNSKLVLIVTGTITDVPQTFPHLVSGVIIGYVIDSTALLQQELYGH